MGTQHTHGALALSVCGSRLSLQVLQSSAGFYIGTADESGPVSRESAEYFLSRQRAERALADGKWTQRDQA